MDLPELLKTIGTLIGVVAGPLALVLAHLRSRREQDIKEREQEVSEATKILDSYKGYCDLLQRQLDSLAQRVAESQEEIASLRQQLEEMTQENVVLRERVSDLESENTSLRQQIADLCSREKKA